MDHPIKRDHSRFRKIIKGKIRDNLKKYVSQGEMPVPKGTNLIRSPCLPLKLRALSLEANSREEWPR